jgi:hypothetical protein
MTQGRELADRNDIGSRGHDRLSAVVDTRGGHKPSFDDFITIEVYQPRSASPLGR